MSIQQLVINVLTITEYPEKDRQSFSEQLMSYAAQIAMASYIKALPEEKQKELEEQLKQKSPEELEAVYKDYLKEEAYKKYFSQEVDTMVGEYITEVEPELTDEQKKKLEEFLEKLPQPEE